jgi:hypothetical protein
MVGKGIVEIYIKNSNKIKLNNYRKLISFTILINQILKKMPREKSFKNLAKAHQVAFREKYKYDFEKYENVLAEKDGKNHANYTELLGVRELLRSRFPQYSSTRDANMLRSEHIPFNVFGPLKNNFYLAEAVFKNFKNLNLQKIKEIKIEYAPPEKQKYLGDNTSFDIYIEFDDTDATNEKKCGIGIEVKYTEKGYSLSETEKTKIENEVSEYFYVSEKSEKFKDKIKKDSLLTKNNLRQIWRNHLLGLAMIENKDLAKFYSMTLYPNGNLHFSHELPKYKEFLKDECKHEVFGVTFEDFFKLIEKEISKETNPEYKEWLVYLNERYIVNE